MVPEKYLDDARPGAPGATRLEALPALLLAAFLGAAACVPDEAILRSKVTWTEGLLLLAATSALLVQIREGRVRVPWLPLLLGGLLPAAIALLLTLTRADLIGRSLARDEVERLLLFPLAFWTVASTACRPWARRLFVGALSLAVMVVAAVAVAQHLANGLGLPLDRYERPPSTFGNPVFLAAFLVLTTPLCAAEALYASGWRRWTGAVATGLALPALHATQSRWAWLAFAVAVGLGVTLLAPAGRPRLRLLAGLAALGLLALWLNRSVLSRPQQHALIWRDTAAMVAERPWGIGPGQFPLAFLDYSSRELLEAYPPSAYVINDAHSEPLQILAELGWPGLAAVALLALALLRRAARSLDDPAADPAERPLRVACLAALVGAIAQSFGSPDLRFVVSTMVFGTVAGLAASFVEPPALRVPGSRALRLALGLLVLLGAGWALAGVWQRLELAELLQPTAAVRPDERAAGTPVPLDSLRERIEAEPLDPSRHYALGLALSLERRHVEAAECFRRALLLEPGNVSVIRSLGVCEGLSGQFAPAANHLRTALEAEPGHVELRYLFAYVCWRRGDLDAAVAALERVLAARPDHRQARLLLEKLRE